MINGKKSNIRFHLCKVWSTETVSKDIYQHNYTIWPVCNTVLESIIFIKMQILWLMMKKTIPPAPKPHKTTKLLQQLKTHFSVAFLYSSLR